MLRLSLFRRTVTRLRSTWIAIKKPPPLAIVRDGTTGDPRNHFLAETRGLRSSCVEDVGEGLRA